LRQNSLAPVGIPLFRGSGTRDLTIWEQFAVHVTGESANAIIAAGAFAVCVPYWENS
jgi:hypothetical protein